MNTIFRSLIITWFCVTHMMSQITTRPEIIPSLSEKSKIAEMRQAINDFYFSRLNNNSLEEKDKIQLKREYKKWNRTLWWSEHYTDDKGSLNRQHQLDEIREYEASKFEMERNNNLRHQPSAFTHFGPYNVTFSLIGGEGIGRVDRITFHPTDPFIIFAGTPHGGLFKSINGGASWVSISKYLPSLGISGIAISSANPNVMYVLSGDGDTNNGGLVNDYLYRSECTGVYKTIDGGDNWYKVSSFPGVTEGEYRGRNLIIDPNNPNILFAATSQGLFRTSNGGDSWTSIISGENIWDVKFNVSSSQEVYVVGDNFFRKSTNGGLGFSPINIPSIQDAQRISMAVTPANSEVIMLFAGEENGMDGVYRSTDGGDNFTLMYGLSGGTNDDLFYNYCDLNVTNYQGLYDNCIAISPTNSQRVLVGGLVIWASDDGGEEWYQETCYWPGSNILGEFVHPDQHTLVYHPNGTLLAGNDGGVYVSYDDGDDWEFISDGLTATQVYRFEPNNDEDDIWGGAQDNGIFEQESGSEYAIYAGGDGFDMITDHPYNAQDGESDDIYYTVNEKIYKDCAGVSDCDISIPNNNSFFGNLAMSPLYEDVLFVGYDHGVYRTIDAGVQWDAQGNQPGNWCISTCPSNQNRMYAAGVNANHAGGIRRWDQGSWANLTNNLISAGYSSGLKITDIEVFHGNSDQVIISCAGFSSGNKIFYTDNGGQTWQNISYNFPNLPVFSLERDNITGVIYAGTAYGIYIKRSGIAYWEPFSNGLPPVPVTDISMVLNVPFGWEVWVSTFGRGLWKADAYQEACPQHLNLTGDVKGKVYRDSEETIGSTQKISYQTGTHLIYNTGGHITLSPGFHAQTGSKFRAQLAGCGNEVNQD